MTENAHKVTDTNQSLFGLDAIGEIISPDKGLVIYKATHPEIDEEDLTIIFSVDYKRGDINYYPLNLTILDKEQKEILYQAELNCVMKTATNLSRQYSILDIINQWLNDNDVKAKRENTAVLFNYNP